MPLFFKNIEAQRVLAGLAESAPMDELEFFSAELREWEYSPARMEMLDGRRYYDGDQEILRRVRTAISADGTPVPIRGAPDERIVDNLFAKHIDTKKNYLLGKPLTFRSENGVFAAAVKKVLGKKFERTLKAAGLEALLSGIAWLYPYYTDRGELAFRMFPGHEILPFWRDSAHTELDCALRLYPAECYIGREKKTVKKAELYRLSGVSGYLFEDGNLIPDPDFGQARDYITVGGQGYRWERIPLIPIKQSDREIPMLRRVKSIQDAINTLRSDFACGMEQDVHSTVLVLKNYDGQDLAEFRQNLAAYGAVKVRTVDGVEGGVETLEIGVNAENYKAILEQLKSAFIENIRSFDGKDDRLKGTANQMNISSLYMDIDLDANDMEIELSAAFEEIFRFVRWHLSEKGVGDFDRDEIDVIFNRDTLVVESAVIENCAKSAGILSQKKILSEHPWVDDVEEELAQLKAEKEEELRAADPYRTAFAASDAKMTDAAKAQTDEKE